MPQPIYRTDYPADCRTHEIDGLTLVYHRPSGATHFLDSPAPEMLTILAEAPCDAAALGARLCDRMGAPFDDEARIVIDRRIEDLMAAGLIRAR